MMTERESLLRLLESDLAAMMLAPEEYSSEISRTKWAIQVLPNAPESQIRSFRKALDRRHREGELGVGMMEELTTEMHEEFEIDEETDRQLKAFSLIQMERDGIPVTSDRLTGRGLTWQLYEHYKEIFTARFGAKK